MKNIKILSVVIAIYLICINGTEVFAQTGVDKDKSAIRANVEQVVSGWNTKSGAEFAKPFAEDADCVIINGMHIKGRTVIAQGHQRIFDTIYKNSTLSYAVEQIRFLRSDVAVVHIRAVLKVTEENSMRTSNARITMAMTKNKDKWEISAFQNTQIEQIGN